MLKLLKKPNMPLSNVKHSSAKLEERMMKARSAGDAMKKQAKQETVYKP